MAVKRSAWVKKVKGDPSDSTQPVVVDGYIGDSTHPDHVRIYLDSRLNRYIDVPEAAVRHQADIAGSTPAGAQRIWLDPDADIKTAPQTMSARFLEGNVAQTYAARAQTRQAARTQGQAAPGEPVPWRTEDPAFCPVRTVPGWDCPIEFTDPRICQPRTIPGVDCPPDLTDLRICNVRTVPGVDCPPDLTDLRICDPVTIPEALCPEQITFAPSTCCLPTRIEPVCTFDPVMCELPSMPTGCGAPDCAPTLPGGGTFCATEPLATCGAGFPCQNLTIVSECNICITRNTPTVCNCITMGGFDCIKVRPTPFTITDPLQLNRMAQLQRSRRAIGRRGLSRF